MPENWKQLVWAIAYYYGFSDTDIWNMTIDQIIFWNEGINWVSKQLKGK